MFGGARGILRRCIFWWLLLLLAASARAERITLDIPVFSGGYGIAFYQETARLFEAERPDIRIRLYGDPRIQDKLRIRMMDGDLPDATFAPRLLWPTLIRAGRVLELTEALEGPNWEGDARWRDTFRPGALGGWQIDGGTYGIPFGYACWSLFYNRGLFQRHGWSEPRTWDEFFALCEQIAASGIAPVSLTGVYGNYPDAFLRAAYYNLAGAEGWAELNNLTPGARTDPRYVRAAGILQRITRHYTLRGWEGATHTAAQLAFFEGRAAMVVSGSWMLNEMEGRIPPGFEVGVMNFPVFPEGVADPTTIQTGADSFFVFATGRPAHQQAALDFLRYLTSRERAAAFVARVNAPVAVRGVPLESFSAAMQPTARLIEQAREAFNMPQEMLQPPAVRQALVDQRKRLMTGEISPEEFAARIEGAAEAVRQRAGDPRAVDYRHPFAGGAFLGVLALIFGTTVWQAARARQRRLRASRSGAATSLESYLGPLRPRFALGFVGPAFLLYAGLVLLPGLLAFGWSWWHWDGLTERQWAGSVQFQRLLFESDAFWQALRNNLFLMLVPAALVVPLALFFASAFHRGVWGASVFRVIFLFPNLLGGIAATLLWLNAYEPHGGLVNASIVALGRGLGIDGMQTFAGFPWLAPANLYFALVPIYLWMACGFNLILYLAAMEGIDPQLYEAADLEGASAWRQFFGITLPLIREVIIISAVFLVIAGLNAFEMIWLLTSQDPDTASHTLGTLMVSSMFKDFDIGRATAIAVLLFALVLAASILLLRGLKQEAVES
jgi:ABC-type sugar transport system permease subunit/ABC-type glycerol-3-phosphate transport system substrate-binding protein